jgi:hypothetical protein
MSLLALVIIMFGELGVLIFSLWLLFRTVISGRVKKLRGARHRQRVQGRCRA